MKTFNLVAEELQETLDLLTDRAAAESLSEVVNLLNSKSPSLSSEVESNFQTCTWWDGDYYCQDENWQWHLLELNQTAQEKQEVKV
jgi:hypothetical protein